MNHLKYSRPALLTFLKVCFGLMLTAVILIEFLNIQTGSTAYYFCYFLGLISPTIGAAFYIWEETRDLLNFKRMFTPVKLSKSWIMILLLPLSLVASFLITALFGLPLELKQLPGLTSLLFGFLGWASIIWLEELGWRGLLLPVLQTRFSPLFATIIINLIWVFWHLPLLYIIGMSSDQILLFSLQTFGIASVLTWAHNDSPSVLVATLIHAAYNATSGWLISAVPSLPPNQLIGVQAAGPLILGLLIIILTKGDLGINKSNDLLNTGVVTD